MAGCNGPHGSGGFLRRVQMRRALGISARGMRPAPRMRGPDRRRGTWWNRKQNIIAIEGKDFAQDTQEGGADEFELIPDSPEVGSDKSSYLLADDDEFVPETEPQDLVAVTTIARPCGRQGRGRGRLGRMLHEWRQAILSQEEEQKRARQIITEKENDHLVFSKEEQQQNNSKQMLEKKRGKEDMQKNHSSKDELGYQKAMRQVGCMMAWTCVAIRRCKATDNEE